MKTPCSTEYISHTHGPLAVYKSQDDLVPNVIKQKCACGLAGLLNQASIIFSYICGHDYRNSLYNINATNLCPELPSSDERGSFPRPRSSAPSVTTTARPITSCTFRTLSMRRKVARPPGSAVMLPRSPACYNKAHIFKSNTFETASVMQNLDQTESLCTTI
jgi:hypothetical protein